MEPKRFLNYLEGLSEKDFVTKVNKDWTVNDVVAHLVGWERECAEVLPYAWETKELPWFMKTDDYDDFNAKNVAEFKNYSVEELLDEWREWQGKLDEEISKIGEDEIRKVDGFEWVLDEGEDGHYDEHFKQIKRTLGD